MPIRAAQLNTAGRVTWCQVRPAVKATAGKMGKEGLAGDYSNTPHTRNFPVRLCHRADVPRMRPGLRARPALRLRRVLRPARGRLRLPAAGPVRHRGRAAEHVAVRAAAP